MHQRLTFLLLTLLITSCASTHVGFIPAKDVLPDATVGKYYEQEIVIGKNIEDKPEFLSEKNTKITIHPTDIGLHIEPVYKRRDGLFVYNNLLIKGVPVSSGNVRVDISGYIYGSMYTKSNGFSKTYAFKVK